MKIALASDHAGFPLKQHLVAYLRGKGHEVLDLGVDTDKVRADYPDAARAVAQAVLEGRAERGILACGSGVGASVAANKFNGIYCAICHDTYSAHQGVEHDNMNVIAFGARIVGTSLAEELTDAFLGATFLGVERYQARFEMIQAFERGES
ncbi:MAG: ribose 5-phosphate isomerase B [Chloroflexi bacterium]|nr:MAG: ribose 5-phosphate isomerase B [Chloroflexota bacterium]